MIPTYSCNEPSNGKCLRRMAGSKNPFLQPAELRLRMPVIERRQHASVMCQCRQDYEKMKNLVRSKEEIKSSWSQSFWDAVRA